MAKLLVREPGQPSRKKDHKPKSVLFKQLWLTSVAINVILLIALVAKHV